MCRAAAAIVPFALLLSPLAACTKETSLTEKGGSCYVATDCAPGLVCVGQRDGTRICTDDLRNLGSPPQAGGNDGGDAQSADAPVTPETGTQDTGTDTSAPPQDAADEG